MSKLLNHRATGKNMDEQVSDAIYCRPSSNVEGGFWVYELSTAQVVHRNKAKLAHSSNAIMTQVETIATKEGMPLGISFGNRDYQITVLDFEIYIDGNHDDNSISNGNYSDKYSQINDDHGLQSND